MCIRDRSRPVPSPPPPPPPSLSRYRLIGLESGSFLLRHYKITQRWAKVFLKALVERNSVMVEVFYMILISQKYDQKPTILKG